MAGARPAMLVALLLYAYCQGERSSRRIEQRCRRDIAYRVLTANQAPDHTTLARFWQDHEVALAELFTQVLRLCAKAGLVKVGLVALDGTKIQANAALAANRTAESLEAEVQRMVAEAAAVDAEEDQRYGPERRGDELPEGLRDRASRLARLQACRERLEREAAEAQAAHQGKLEARQAEEAATGKPKRGRKPKPPDPALEATAKANVTDPDSRIMKTQKGYVQGYNAQAVVTAEQIIVAAAVTQETNDVKQLHPMLTQAQETLQAVGHEPSITVVVADAGYWSEANVTTAEPAGPELLVATTKDWKQRKALREQPPP